MKTDLSPDTDVSLLPRADLPVIWDAFKAKAEAIRATAETLTVTCITQKEEMALARTTRLTLREIRIAVENKRVELGESHLKEIKKVNGAANAIKEFIQPLEARLLVQEGFGERAEAARIAALSDSRFAEIKLLRPGSVAAVWSHLGTMPDEEYNNLLARLQEEKAEIEAANRLRVEAERRLAEVRVEAQKRAIELQLELKAESDRIRAEAKAEQDRMRVQHAKEQAEVEAEQERQNAIAEAKALEVYAELKRQNEAEHAIRVIEALRRDNERAVRDADAAEQKRIRDEQYAKLEAELAQANAAKRAEAEAARKLALAPDVEKLRAFWVTMRSIPNPELKTDEAIACLMQARFSFTEALSVIETFCLR